ncbi:DUF4493 domain-containing protein [Maribacter sp. 2307UL18-2]|uniref:DUF4493 domain-containing protein n=1 Tax=Maribacter sp. 2307UL18-2 TaxID=3386274 RepID=UPI0039BCBD96
MIHSLKYFCCLVIVALLASNCQKDNLAEAVLTQTEIDEPTAAEVDKGTLSITAQLKGAINITTARALTLEEALDLMLVEITSVDGQTIFVSENYRDLPTNIELPAGNYSMLLSNFPLSDVRFDQGVYGDYIPNFEIVAATNTKLNPVLKLLDLATTVNFSSAIVAAYPDVSAYVARSQLPASIFSEFPTPLRYEVVDNGRRGYHSLFSGNHTSGFTEHTGELFILISATGPSGDDIRVSRVIKGATGNQQYTINVEMADPTTTSLNVTIASEEDLTEIITFPN